MPWPTTLVLTLVLTLAPAADYSAEEAESDVEVILVDRGQGYLSARARLEAHGGLAAKAILDRLGAVPAPTPEKKQRLLSVLAALQLPEHVDLFEAQLRNALLDHKPPEPWRGLLMDQGERALPSLKRLAADTKLRTADRAELLEAVVALTPNDRLGELTKMLGAGGDSTLEGHLKRALQSRARQNPHDRAAIATALDEAIDSAKDDRRLAILLIVRANTASAAPGGSTEFLGRLSAHARDASASFIVRVAALHGLGTAREELGAASSLRTVVRQEAPKAKSGDQQAEILTWLALEALPDDQAGVIASELDLLGSPAPRLARRAYQVAPLGPGHGWLDTSQQNPWPQVRRAALGRVEGPCDKNIVKQLARRAGTVSGGGDEDVTVGRSAVAALGRCGTEEAFDALANLLGDSGVQAARRVEAARQLVEHDPKGPALVGKVLLQQSFPRLSGDLADGMRFVPEPTDEVHTILCKATQLDPAVASRARAALDARFKGRGCEKP